MIKVSHTIPVIYKKLREKFNVDWNKGVIITYGDVVYTKFAISKALEVHEATHVRQQMAMGKDIWWRKYLNDTAFRLSQEKEAYINQACFYRIYINDPEESYEKIKKIIDDFSGPMYGNMISRDDAKKLLTSTTAFPTM